MLALIVVLVISACASKVAEDEARYEGSLSEFGGCSDVSFWASNKDRSIALYFHVKGLLDGALTAAKTNKIVYQLPSDVVDVQVKTGVDLQHGCQDYSETTTKVENIYVPVAGSAEVTIVPGTRGEYEWDNTGTGTLILDDLRLINEKDAKDEIELDRVEISDVSIGWMPG